MSKKLLLLVPLAVGVAISIAMSTPGSVGPPWISVEMPANPLDPETRNAVLVVRAYHHATPAGYSLAGTAEGVVNGERRTIELDLTGTSRPGVYALAQQWPSEGNWILAIAIKGRADGSLLVELGSDGGVSHDKFYDLTTRVVSVRSVRAVPGALGKKEIETALRSMAEPTED